MAFLFYLLLGMSFMANKQRFIRNSTASILQTILSVLILFFLYKHLIVHLGSEQLGLWSVILASISFARLSEMGLAGSVVKFVARYIGLGEKVQAAEIIQTAAISIATIMAIFCFLGYFLLDKFLVFVIPKSLVSQASILLPWTFLSLWLGSVAGVFQSGLDGCQRFDIRSTLLVLSNIFFFALVFFTVSNFGLVGLAISQVLQSLFFLLATWFALRKQLQSLSWLPFFWRKDKFSEMLSYAFSFQIISIASLLSDPIVKLLMSHFGGLSVTGFYEMASQLIIKLRSLILAVTQLLVPIASELNETSPKKIRNFYLQNFRLLFLIAVPLYCITIISLPLISIIWIGYIEIKFIIFGVILGIGWGFNTLVTPAYFINLGIGNLRPNYLSHILLGLINLGLSLVLGPNFGAEGVALAFAISLFLSSSFILYSIHRYLNIPFTAFIPKAHYPLIKITIMMLLIFTITSLKYLLGKQAIFLSIINIMLFLTLSFVVFWLHPYRKLILFKIKSITYE